MNTFHDYSMISIETHRAEMERLAAQERLAHSVQRECPHPTRALLPMVRTLRAIVAQMAQGMRFRTARRISETGH